MEDQQNKVCWTETVKFKYIIKEYGLSRLRIWTEKQILIIKHHILQLFPVQKLTNLLRSFKEEIKWQEPNKFLYKFEGALKFKSSNIDAIESSDIEGEFLNVPLTTNKLLLWDSWLRNTDYIYGVVVYTGHDS